MAFDLGFLRLRDVGVGEMKGLIVPSSMFEPPCFCYDVRPSAQTHRCLHRQPSTWLGAGQAKTDIECTLNPILTLNIPKLETRITHVLCDDSLGFISGYALWSCCKDRPLPFPLRPLPLFQNVNRCSDSESELFRYGTELVRLNTLAHKPAAVVLSSRCCFCLFLNPAMPASFSS